MFFLKKIIFSIGVKGAKKFLLVFRAEGAHKSMSKKFVLRVFYPFPSFVPCRASARMKCGDASIDQRSEKTSIFLERAKDVAK